MPNPSTRNEEGVDSKEFRLPPRFLAVFSGMAALDVRVRLALVADFDSGLKARDVKAWAGVAPSCRFGKFSSPEMAKPCYVLSGLTHSRADLPGASLADSLHPRLSHRGLSAWSTADARKPIPPKTANNRQLGSRSLVHSRLRLETRFLAVFSGMAALDVRVRLALVAHLDSGLKAREVKAWAGVAPSDGGPGCRFGKLSSPERAKPCYALSGLTHSRADLPGASLADSLHPRLSQPGLSALSAVGPAPVSPGPDSIPPKTAKNQRRRRGASEAGFSSRASRHDLKRARPGWFGGKGSGLAGEGINRFGLSMGRSIEGAS